MTDDGHGWGRRLHFWLFLVWLVPGAAVSWLLRNSVAWVAVMSWYALVVAHLTGWIAGRAEDAANNTTEG